MGFHASNWAWGIDLKEWFEGAGLNPRLATGTTRTVFSFLAHVHNDEKGGHSFYSYKQMADRCHISRKTAIEHCSYLEQCKLLKVKRNKSEDGLKNERNHFYLIFKTQYSSGDHVQEHDYSESGVVTSGDQGGNVRLLGVVTSGDPKQEVKQEKNIYTSSENDECVGNVAEKKSAYDPVPYEDILATYAKILPDNPQVRKLRPKRKKAIKALWNDDEKHQNLDWWERYFKYVSNIPFLTGEVTDFKANIDWLVNLDNFTQIIEGKYKPRQS